MSDPDFEFSLFNALKVRARGHRACNRATIVILFTILLVAAPIAGGLTWAIATGMLSPIALLRLAGAWK